VRAAAAAFVVELALSLSSRHSAAQARDPARADNLFREARQAMREGDLETACPKFAESQRLDPAAGTAVNLGDCFDKQGKVASALLAYQAARDLLHSGDRRLAPINAQIAKFEKRVPRLTISLSKEAPSATSVRRDDRLVSADKLGVAVALNPGKHTVVVSAPGRIDKRYQAELAEGDVRELIVEPGAVHQDDVLDLSTPAPARNDQQSTQPTEQVEPSGASDVETRTGGTIIAVLGATAAAFGGIALYEAHSYKNDSDQARDQATRDSKYSTAEQWQTAGIVSLVAGAAGLTIGGYLVITAMPASPASNNQGIRAAIGGLW
jgi:tetratricopeptide (TPR) repeat protein